MQVAVGVVVVATGDCRSGRVNFFVGNTVKILLESWQNVIAYKHKDS
jgi:hypothetical protein